MADTDNDKKPESTQLMEATFSTLVMSLGSSALMSLGVIPDPSTGKTVKDKEVAKFNIDLLLMLKSKTKNNLSNEEEQTIDAIVSDLQLKYVQS